MKKKFGLFGFILVIFLFIVGVTGWFLNIVKLTKLDFKPPYKAEVIRLVSITPIGALTGWLKIEDK